MSRFHTIALAIKDRLEAIPELRGNVVVYRTFDIDTEFETRMAKTRGKAVIIRLISTKNRSKTSTANFQASFTISLFTVPVLTQKDAKDVDDLMEEIVTSLQGWWPSEVPSNGGLLRIHCDSTTYPENPNYSIAVMTIEAPKIKS